MEFEKAMKQAAEVLTFDARFMDPKQPQGLWLCSNVAEVSDIKINAACMGTGVEWGEIVKCRPFFAHFPYLVIVSPDPTIREMMIQELRPRLPTCCIYVVRDSGFQNCHSISEYIATYGLEDLPRILSGSVELPCYGMLNLADVQRRDMTKIPRTLSRFDRLDKSIGGFFAGELSVWTGKRGVGKSTILSQILLEAVDQGHVVCAYSGELDKTQFREWTYLQAAGPEHVAYITDRMTGKRIATADAIADKQISEWLDERFWLFDLEKNTRHDPEAILSQFEYMKMRYNADVFLVDNIMSVDFDYRRDSDFNRIQSQFTQLLATFSKRQHVHTHLVVHPRKSTSDENGKVSADDVNGSADITNRADNVFFLTTHASTDDKNQPTTKPLLMTMKNRDFGSKINQWLDFDKKSRRFFVDKTGDPKRAYGWDQTARQITLLDRCDEIDEVFPEEDKKQ